jgi:hypothetical protein
MFREAEEMGLPAPEILEIGMRMWFVVPLAQTVAVDRSVRKIESGLESETARTVLQVLRNNHSSGLKLPRRLGMSAFQVL